MLYFSKKLECIKTKLEMKKSRIRETSNLSTDTDCSTDTTVGGTQNTQKQKKLKTEKIIKNSKMSRDMPKLAVYPSTRGL